MASSHLSHCLNRLSSVTADGYFVLIILFRRLIVFLFLFYVLFSRGLRKVRGARSIVRKYFAFARIVEPKPGGVMSSTKPTNLWDKGRVVTIHGKGKNSTSSRAHA